MNNPTSVAIDLTHIQELHLHLRSQAIHKANHREMPGGEAMVALGPVANREAWEHKQETSERTGLHLTAPELEDEHETPTQLVFWWSERWRRELGAEYDAQTPSLVSELNFLRWNLAWGAANETHWHKFADDIRTARVRLETILHDGQRDIVSDDVTCLLCATPLRRRMTAHDGYEDEWWCRDCGVHLTPAQFNLAASESARRAVGLD